jgi:hypothetical protein
VCPQAGAPTEFARTSPKSAPALWRGRLATSWRCACVDADAGRDETDCGRQASGVVDCEAGTDSTSCGSASEWLRCGIAVAVATADGVLARARAGARPRLGWARKRDGRVAMATIATGPDIGRATVSRLDFCGAACDGGGGKSVPGFV